MSWSHPYSPTRSFHRGSALAGRRSGIFVSVRSPVRMESGSTRDRGPEFERPVRDEIGALLSKAASLRRRRSRGSRARRRAGGSPRRRRRPHPRFLRGAPRAPPGRAPSRRGGGELLSGARGRAIDSRAARTIRLVTALAESRVVTATAPIFSSGIAASDVAKPVDRPVVADDLPPVERSDAKSRSRIRSSRRNEASTSLERVRWRARGRAPWPPAKRTDRKRPRSSTVE
jgi:hypothetical protein